MAQIEEPEIRYEPQFWTVLFWSCEHWGPELGSGHLQGSQEPDCATFQVLPNSFHCFWAQLGLLRSIWQWSSMQDGVHSFLDAVQKNRVCTQLFPLGQTSSRPEIWTGWGAFFVPVHGFLEDLQKIPHSQQGMISQVQCWGLDPGGVTPVCLCLFPSPFLCLCRGKGTDGVAAGCSLDHFHPRNFWPWP